MALRVKADRNVRVVGGTGLVVESVMALRVKADRNLLPCEFADASDFVSNGPPRQSG